MDVRRRQLMLAGLGLGVGAMIAPRLLHAGETDAFSTYGIVPGGEADLTAMLQRAADQAARSGTPLFLQAGVYSTRRLTLKSGTYIKGVPGRTMLRYRGGGAILSVAQAGHVRLSGLVLDGDNRPLGNGGALLAASDAKHLDISGCRFIAGSEHGIVLRRVSGRIAACEIAHIGKTGLVSEDCGDLAIAENLIDKAATGLSLIGFKPGAGPVLVRGNVIRDLYLRKTVEWSGAGIVVKADSVVRDNVIDGAPAYGILIGDLRARVAGNTIRNAYIDIATINKPLSQSGGEA